MENNENEDETWNDETELDTEFWLYGLLALTGDPQRKAELIRTIAEKTNQPSEQIEKIIAASLDFMMDKKAKPKLN